MVRTSVFLIVAASLVAYCAGVTGRPRCSHEPRSLVPVVVVASDVEPGTPLTYDLLSQRSVYEPGVSAQLVRPEAASLLVGQAPLRKLKAGELISWSDLSFGVGSRLAENKRAVVVELDREVREGDRLDLLQQGDGAPLLENALALTAGKSPWLQVTPEEAGAIARWAQRRPTFTVVLRGR